MQEPSDELFSLPMSGKEFDMPAMRVALALLGERTRSLTRQIEALEELVKLDYVVRHEFKPVMRLVYGMASLMLVAVVTAIVNSVLKVHA